MSQLLQPAALANAGGPPVGPDKVYQFDGTTMFATMPVWTPLGVSYQISMVIDPINPATGSNQHLLNGSGLEELIILSGGAYRHRYTDAAAGAQTVTGAIATGNEETVVIASSGAGVTLNPGAGSNVTLVDPATITFTHIASSTSGAANFGGWIKDLMLTDLSGLNGRSVVTPDSISLPRRIDLASSVQTSGSNWTLDFDLIREDNPNDTTSYAMGAAVNADSNVRIYNESNGAVPSRFRVRALGQANTDFDTVLTSVAQGQHCHIQVVAAGGNLSVSVDGGTPEVSVGGAGPFKLDHLYGSGGVATTLYLGAGGMGNVVLTDDDTGGQWSWAMDEGTGTAITGTAAGGATPVNGVLTSEAWTAIAENSRQYPMIEGTGDTFFDVIGDSNATIQNFNEANWVNP
jgi:hypothetical protein